VKDGDEVETLVFDGRISVTPKSAEARKRAWDRVFAIIDEVRVRPGQTPMTEDEIAEEVKAVRRARRARRQHD
jgi:hypothetical protein